MTKVRIDALEGGVRVLTLNDPTKRNAMGHQMSREIIGVCEAFRNDDQTRALVVTGEGTAFCAGGDLPDLFGDTDRSVAETHATLQAYYQVFLTLFALPFPTVAAVNGPAVGAGLNLALACDVRIASPVASFGATFAQIGLHPGGGCTWFLVHALGASRALRTLLLGDTLDAGRAIAWGLADGPEDDCVGVATDLASRFAALDPGLARGIKRTVRLAVETNDLAAVTEYEAWAQAASASSPVVRSWVNRFRK